jgi:hypothetical protein
MGGEDYVTQQTDKSGALQFKENEMKSKLYALAGLVLTASLVLVPSQTLKAAAAEHHDSLFFPGTIVGTWTVQVQQYNCQTEEPLGKPFQALLTFAEGGTMTGSTTNPGFAIGQRGTDQGVWSYEGHRTYKAKDISFLFYSTPAAPPASPGFQAGTQTLTQEIEFKNGRNEFTSDAKVEFADTTGAVYRQGCAWAVAQRFK